MPSLLASEAAAEATLAAEPPPGTLEVEEPDELEELDELPAPEELEAPELDELLATELALPPEELDRLTDDRPEGVALVLSVEPPPQALKLRQSAVAAAMCSAERRGYGMSPEHS